MAQFIQRRVVAAAAEGSSLQAPLGAWETLYAALGEFLTLPEWEPGVARVTGSLSLFVESGVWKCCLSDRDGGQVAFMSARSPEDLFASLEKGLRAGTLDWRAMRDRAGHARKK